MSCSYQSNDTVSVNQSVGPNARFLGIDVRLQHSTKELFGSFKAANDSRLFCVGEDRCVSGLSLIHI